MVKPEWGHKRTCPKCATRFYDLGEENPVTCIECGTQFLPEPVLKSKQPLPFEAALLVLLAGVFSAADAALASFSHARAEELVAEGRPGSKRLVALLEDSARNLTSRPTSPSAAPAAAAPATRAGSASTRSCG